MVPFRVGCVIAGGIAAAVLAGCASSASPARATAASAITAAHGRAAADWDIDGDGHRDHARLVYLGGHGANNWELVVNMTSYGQQTVRFTGSPPLPGSIDAPAIAGSVDADRDGHAEIFVRVASGASTQFWTIFKLAGRHIRQVTSQGQPVRLAVGGSVTHQGGFRCDGAQFVTVGETTGPSSYVTWTYERDVYHWYGTRLVLVSKRTGKVTSAQPAIPPAAYSGISCGDLLQYAPR